MILPPLLHVCESVHIFYDVQFVKLQRVCPVKDYFTDFLQRQIGYFPPLSHDQI